MLWFWDYRHTADFNQFVKQPIVIALKRRRVRSHISNEHGRQKQMRYPHVHNVIYFSYKITCYSLNTNSFIFKQRKT
jgi:hypothetical protein